MILQQGAVKLLIDILNKTDNLDIKRNGSWALSNIVRGRPLPKYEDVKETVPVFCSLFQKEIDQEICLNSAWGLSYLSEYSSDNQGVIPMGIIPIFLKYIEFFVFMVYNL